MGCSGGDLGGLVGLDRDFVGTIVGWKVGDCAGLDDGLLLR